MKFSLYSSVLCLLSANAALASSNPKAPKPCTTKSPTTDRYYDLNPLHRTAPEDGKKAKEGEEGSWHSRGYDYGVNFTINFCGSVVEELDHVVDLNKDVWKNVSAYYEKGGKTYSIGLQNTEPVFRGRKLVLNYTGGSLCSTSKHSRRADLLPRKIIDPDDDEDDDDPVDDPEDEGEDEDAPSKSKPSKSSQRRKSSIISLLCESDPMAKTSVSFVGASPDECTYFFEARSPAACGGIEADTQALGPGGVFGVIVLIAVLVYLVGGCVYQRTVMHQRGWRQLPNYTMWAGIGGFLRDMFIILTSSCAGFLPSRRGYSRVSLGADHGRRGGRRNDDENRLIDNLDEEWDD